MEYWRFRGNVSPCNKQTTKRLVETRTRAHVCHVHTSAGIVQVAKNIKRRGGERASCFRAIKHFHFQFLVGAERRGAVGGQPVADDRWFVYRRSLCSSTLISHPPSLSLYLSLPLSLPRILHLVSHPLARPFRSLCCFNFFRGFPFRAASLHPRSIDNPAIRITLENRTDTKQLFNAAYCGFGLSLCWNTPESRLSERLLYEVTVSSIILLSLNGESQPSTGEINSPSRGPAIIRGSFHRMEKRGAAMKSYDSFGDGYTRSKNDLKKRKGNKR